MPQTLAAREYVGVALEEWLGVALAVREYEGVALEEWLGVGVREGEALEEMDHKGGSTAKRCARRTGLHSEAPKQGERGGSKEDEVQQQLPLSCRESAGQDTGMVHV